MVEEVETLEQTSPIRFQYLVCLQAIADGHFDYAERHIPELDLNSQNICRHEMGVCRAVRSLVDHNNPQDALAVATDSLADPVRTSVIALSRAAIQLQAAA